MARSKAKSIKTKSCGSGNNGNNGGENIRNESSVVDNPHHQQPITPGASASSTSFGSSNNRSHPQVQFMRAEDVRVSENLRPMTEKEVQAQQMKHLKPYQPETEPPTLVKYPQTNGRVRVEFPKRDSNYNPYDRWNDNGQFSAAEEESKGGSESSKTSSRGRGRGGRKGGIVRHGGGGRIVRNTPLHGSQGRLSYSLLGIAKENPSSRERQVIYGVAFNQWTGLSADVFATVGDNSVTVYQCDRSLKGGFQGLASYYAPGEIFYSCDWSRARKPNTSILVFAGDRGHIRTITFHPYGGQEQHVIGSHPHAVNDVKVDCKDPEICATGAADHSLRLWNVEKRILIAIFGGSEGPRNQVVSVSFHDHYPIVAGTGIDHTIHFWDLGSEELKMKIAASKEYTMHKYTFQPVLQHMPKWVTRDIHSNFVDCIAFWGDWVITRSVNEDIILWRCGRDGEHLMELNYEVFNEDLHVLPAVPPVWMQQPSPISRRLTVLSQVADASKNFVPDHANRESRKEKPSMKKKDKEEDKELSSSFSNNTSKSSKINIGPDVQIGQKFLVKNSSSWFLRFGIDYEHKLLGFGNEVGDYSVFYLGQSKDQETLAGMDVTAFKQVHEMRIPVFPDIANCFVRQVAFNYTGQLMVGVTDRCHVALYRITVHELPKGGKRKPGKGPDGVGRIFAKAGLSTKFN